MNRKLLVCIMLAIFLAPLSAWADVKLPAVISDHMVLEGDMNAPIWGWADPGEAVTVSIGDVSKTTKADKRNGRWLVKLDKLKGPGPLTLTVQGKNTLTVSDVLVGEVWLCSGQSNMNMKVREAKNFDKERPAAQYPQLRMFKVVSKQTHEPQTNCEGSWKLCTPENVGEFSATGYFFGRELHQKLGVPVGLIDGSVGGTPIEAWTSLEAQQGKPELQNVFDRLDARIIKYDPVKAQANYEKDMAEYPALLAKAKAAGEKLPREPRKPLKPYDQTSYPGVLFNGYISPVIPYGIHGAIWYQGEGNAGTPETAKVYRAQLPTLIKDWRTRWGQGDFPFAWVQLPNFQSTAKGWPEMRQSMLDSLSTSNTGMTVNIDIGDLDDIHPKNKQDIGRRLALWALAEVYGKKLAWSGPLFSDAKVVGDQIEISFIHTEGNLSINYKYGKTLRGFTIAGADGKWIPAQAEIKEIKVLVSSPEVKQPVAVRYSWNINPDGNLTNGATGLPASPFRTDQGD